MNQSYPRIMIAGTHSGSGKTTLTMGILEALKQRGFRVSSFKVGPDYLDPMFHSAILGTTCRNLDLFFLSEKILMGLFQKNSKGSDLSVIEGVMGYYDGLGLSTTEASSYHTAKLTQTPVVLVVDAKGSALSIVAVLQGFLDFLEDSQIAGVIFNRCSSMVYSTLKQVVTERFKGRIRPLGFLPTQEKYLLESRHLGLISASEIEDLKGKITLMKEAVEEYVDIEGFMELARQAPKLEEMSLPSLERKEEVRIAVAMDQAFCFYYQDNLDLLREMGASLEFFSPMTDRLPDCHGLYIGGGYPELHAKKLSENSRLLEQLKERISGGLPVIAECGGLMYLSESIDGYPMVGVIPGNATDQGKLVRFGYVELIAKKDSLIAKKGDKLRAHEFHHWDLPNPGSDVVAQKKSGKCWEAAFTSESYYAGFPHLHFYADGSVADRFYRACLKEKKHGNR